MKSSRGFLLRKIGNSKKCAGYVPALFLLIALAWYISTFHYQLMMIQGDSMSPSFHNLQLVILDKHPEVFTYGDVIAFECEGLDAVLVKRVVACPGDTVQIVVWPEQDNDCVAGGVLLVNGETSTVYGAEAVFDYAGLAAEPLVLGPGEYFVIGDNVAESKDSRYEEVGVVREESVIGRVRK